MAWYSTGTVSVTNGSTTVTGSGTNFTSGARAGEAFYGPDGRLYEVGSVVSSTQLTLNTAYLGSTASGQSYAIIPTQGLTANLATQVSNLITDYQDIADLAGSGKFGDGTVTSPGIRFNLDQNTGLYRETDNEIAVSAGGLKVAEFNSTGLNNVTIGETTPAAGSFTTGSFTGNVSFADNAKAVFGAGSDLQIYHDGSNSRIDDAGTGNLILRGNSAVSIQKYTGETLGVFNADGSVLLAYDNAAKFETTNTGVDVTGTVTADGLTVDGTSVLDSEANFVSDLNASNKSLVLASTGATGGEGQLGASLAFSRINTDSPRAAIAAINTAGSFERMGLSFWTHPSNTADAMVKRMQIDHAGDISFYEDTGTTPKFFWDASAESLGIGTVSPSAIIHATNSGGFSESLALFEAASTRNGYFYINGDDNRRKSLVFQSGGVDKFSMGVGDSDELSASSFFIGSGKTGGSGADLVIDSSGNVGIGHSSPEAALTVTPESGNFNATYNSYDGVGLFLRGNGTAGNGNYGPALVFGSADSDGLNQENKHSAISMVQTGSDANQTGLAFWVHSSDSSTANLEEAMRIDSSGNVGIGSSPDVALHVESSVSGASTSVAALVNPNGGVVGTGARLWLSGTNATTRGAYIDAIVQNSGNAHDMVFATGGNASSPVERMRLDASGNLLVGTTSTTVYTSGSGGDAGVNLRADGQISNSSNSASVFNRMASDGPIHQFRRDGVEVGSIGTSSFGNFRIHSSQASHVGLEFGSPNIMPTNNSGVLTDGGAELGSSSYRFSNLHLSGGVVFGATGGSVTSKTLDDYEEGTWTPSAEFTSANPTAGASTGSGRYVKVGGVVTVWFNLNNINVTGASGDFIVTGVPFSMINDAALAFVSNAVRGRFVTFSETLLVGIADGESQLRFEHLISDANAGTISASDCSDGDTDFSGFITYPAS